MKFKVGDRVRVKYSDTVHFCNKPLWDQLGYSRCETGRVSVVDPGDSYPYCVKLDIMRGDDDGKWWVEESELELIPSIPDGWTPASEPPNDHRTVRVITKDGECFGWCSNPLGIAKWFVFDDTKTIGWVHSHPGSAAGSIPGEVIAWREIEPEPERLKVGQRVRVVKLDSRTLSERYRIGDTGVVVRDAHDYQPYSVVFDESGDNWWCFADELEPIPDPAPQPKKRADEYVVVNIRQRFDSFEAAEADALREVDKNGVQFVVARIVELVNPGKPEVIRIEE